MSLFSYPYLNFSCPTYYCRASPSPAYHQIPYGFNPHYTTSHVPTQPSYDVDDMMYAEDEEAAAYYNHLQDIQRKRKAAHAAKRAREAAHAQAQAEREAAFKAELARTRVMEEEKQKRHQLKLQEEERRKRRAYAETISRAKAERRSREPEDSVHTLRTSTRDSHHLHRPHRVNELDNLDSLFATFFGINVAPQNSSASAESDVESESEAGSTSASSASEPTASSSHVGQAVPQEIEAPETVSPVQKRSVSPSSHASTATKADIPKEQVAGEEEEASTTISEGSSASLASLASTEQQLATLKSSFTFPSRLSFAQTTPGSHPPPLLFNRLNAPYHAQANALLQLLLQADSVESNGDKKVRNRRKEVVKKVEEEIANLERHRDDLWMEAKGRRERGEESEPAADEERSWSDGISVAAEQ